MAEADAWRTTGAGRNRTSRSGVRTVNNQTFIHGDCQWLPSTLSGPCGEQGRQATLLRGRFTVNGRITHRPKIRPRGLRRQSRQLSSCTTCLSRLCGRCGLAHGAAAIGAGTGTATRRLLDLGANPLVAIEPDARFATFLRETIEDRALIEHRVKAWQLVLDPDQTVALYATYSNINIRRDCERSSLSWVASLATSSTVA